MVSSMSLPECPLHLWAFSTLHQVCMAWSSPPGAHHHLHPCCQHSACHPQQALVKAANSELNNVGEGSPSLNEMQPHLMIFSRVLLKQSASSPQAQVWSLTDAGIRRRLKVILPTFPSGLVQTGMILHMYRLLALLPKWELKINLKYCGWDYQQMCKEIIWCAFLWKL